MKINTCKTLLPRAALFAALLGIAGTIQAQHIDAGALGTSQNDQLYFVNGASFVTNSGYVKQLTFTNSGTFAGFYNGGLTFTALAATIDNGGPFANAAALGSFLTLQIESVSTTSGGTFSFWQSGVPVFSGNDGLTGGTFRFDLSDSGLGAGLPGADPYGHLHGRRFTATTPGLYTIGFRIFDESTNGVGNGPIHTPSELFYVNFEAVPEPATAALLGLGAAGLGIALFRSRKRTIEK